CYRDCPTLWIVPGTRFRVDGFRDWLESCATCLLMIENASAGCLNLERFDRGCASDTTALCLIPCNCLTDGPSMSVGGQRERNVDRLASDDVSGLCTIARRIYV